MGFKPVIGLILGQKEIDGLVIESKIQQENQFDELSF